jgi:hypothetical protein
MESQSWDNDWDFVNLRSLMFGFNGCSINNLLVFENAS